MKTAAGYSTVHKAMAVVSAFSYGEPVLGVLRSWPAGSTWARARCIASSGRSSPTATWSAHDDERYRLSIKMYEIGQQVAASIELRELVHPALERLRNESGERPRTSGCSQAPMWSTSTGSRAHT